MSANNKVDAYVLNSVSKVRTISELLQIKQCSHTIKSMCLSSKNQYCGRMGGGYGQLGI